jgi:hypothetical protein
VFATGSRYEKRRRGAKGSQVLVVFSGQDQEKFCQPFSPTLIALQRPFEATRYAGENAGSECFSRRPSTSRALLHGFSRLIARPTQIPETLLPLLRFESIDRFAILTSTCYGINFAAAK